MIKNVQIRLKSSIPIEKRIIDYLESLGGKSSEAKRFLINGFLSENSSATTTATHEDKTIELTTETAKTKPFGSLLKKRN